MYRVVCGSCDLDRTVDSQDVAVELLTEHLDTNPDHLGSMHGTISPETTSPETTSPETTSDAGTTDGGGGRRDDDVVAQ